jgi:hypothetical protein
VIKPRRLAKHQEDLPTTTNSTVEVPLPITICTRAKTLARPMAPLPVTAVGIIIHCTRAQHQQIKITNLKITSGII